MNWIFDDIKKEWNFESGGETLIKIKIIEKPANKVNKITVKIYFSTFFAGKKKLKSAETQNVLWLKQNTRKFKNSVDCEKYLELKKTELSKQISNNFK